MFVVVRMPDGSSHRLEALEGWRVMEVIRDWGLPIKAECGGACACATCHVWVDEAWVAKLPAPTDEELEMLDGAFHVDERSRLCCQIIMAPELDGLEVELAPESLADAPQAAPCSWDLEKMRTFPIFVSVERKPPLVTGGGELAAIKTRLLLEARRDRRRRRRRARARACRA